VSADLHSEFLDLVRAAREFVAAHADAGTFGFPKGPKWAPIAEPHGTATTDAAQAELTTNAYAERARPQSVPATSTATRGLDLPEFVAPPEASQRGSTPQTLQPVHIPLVRADLTNETDAAQLARRATARLRLPELANGAAQCTRCILHKNRQRSVFARGNPDAALCFIGDAPSHDDQSSGQPFTGESGQLLDRMIFAMGLDPETQVYITNLVKCTPPSFDTLGADEMTSCGQFLDEQLALSSPKVIVALGHHAAATILGNDAGFARARGQWKLHRGRTLVMVTHHPRDLEHASNKQAQAKKETWQDLQLVMKELGLGVPRRRK
jgi:uracil-DNA glycosylase